MTLLPILQDLSCVQDGYHEASLQSSFPSGKLAKWLILLTEFDVQYLTKKMIKGRAVTEFLALNPIPYLEEVQLDFLDDLNITIEVQG